MHALGITRVKMEYCKIYLASCSKQRFLIYTKEHKHRNFHKLRKLMQMTIKTKMQIQTII